MKRIAAACVLCAAIAVVSTPCPRASAPSVGPDSAAGGTVIDRVVATIEDRAIMKSEIDNEVKRFLMQTQRASLPADEEKKIRSEILDGLVADALLSIQAETDKIQVDDKEVDAAVDRTIEENRTALGGDDAFAAQLKAEGLTLEGLRAIYRDKMRDRMLVERLMYEKVTGEIKVTDSQVQEYYNAHVSEFPQRQATVSIAHILILPKPSDEVLGKALERITMVERKLKAGGDFAELAKEHSDCPSAKFGGSLGTLNLDDLNNPPFAEAARRTAVGQVSPPILTEFGYHLIKIEGVEGDQVTLRHILVSAQATPDDVAAAAKLAERVRSEITAGADFAKEAAQYSGDYATKDDGGVIGQELPLESLPEQFKELIKNVPEGAVAPVIEEARGLRIVKILKWNAARAYTYAEAKDELRKILQQQKIQERLGAYVEELKKNYFVEIRGE